MNRQKVPGSEASLPASTLNHHKQTVRQIWLPLFIFILLVLIVAVLATLGTANNAVNGLHWANISFIFMIIPNMLAGLIYLAILAGLIYLIVKLRLVFPLYAYRAQAFLYQVAIAIRRWADSSTKPVMTAKGWAAAWKRISSLLVGFSKPTPPKEKPSI
jgi:hypothetical protein